MPSLLRIWITHPPLVSSAVLASFSHVFCKPGPVFQFDGCLVPILFKTLALLPIIIGDEGLSLPEGANLSCFPLFPKLLSVVLIGHLNFCPRYVRACFEKTFLSFS